MRERLSMLLLLGLSLPFLDKPIHVDDANFLAMARQASIDPWRPHAFLINWQGTTESAFHVLSNPPGIAWWLAPVAQQSVMWMHVWMLPWLLLACWGAARLGERFGGHPAAAVLLLCGAPISVISTQALTPDLPLLALTLAGVGGLLHSPPTGRMLFALLLGSTALFRYSGLALLPLILLLPCRERERTRLLMAGLMPITALMIHNWLAYGEIHLVAMMGFQSVSNSGIDIAHKSVAAMAALGGAAVLPILCWSKARQSLIGALVGGLLGWVAANWTGQMGGAVWGTTLFSAAGGATLAGAMRHREPVDGLLLCWLVGGALFLLSLRFTASRYWIPFFAPAVLLVLRDAKPSSIRIGCIATLALSTLLAIDDAELAHAQRTAATIAQTKDPGFFAGHWGFQHHLESHGWVAIEDDQDLPKNQWVAHSRTAWPQQASNACWASETTVPIPDKTPGPRVLTYDGRANLHGNMLAEEPPIRTFSPWGIGRDPLDWLTMRQTCP